MQEERHGMVEMTPINQEMRNVVRVRMKRDFKKRMISSKRAVLICLLYRNDESQWERA
jgi:hypothetical protein